MKFVFRSMEGKEISVEVSNETMEIMGEDISYTIKLDDLPIIEAAFTEYYRKLMQKIAEKKLVKG